jgi:hypothetical protein
LESDAVQIQQRVYQGNLDTPKSGKARVAALSNGTLADLRMWRKMARSTAADAFVFPSENPASPLDRKTCGAHIRAAGRNSGLGIGHVSGFEKNQREPFAATDSA